MEIKRGDILYADLTPAVGAEQGGTRPVLVMQSNLINADRLDMIIVIPITTNKSTADSAEDMTVDVPEMSELFNHKILVNQLRAISPLRFREHIGHASPEVMAQVEEKLKIALGL